MYTVSPLSSKAHHSIDIVTARRVGSKNSACMYTERVLDSWYGGFNTARELRGPCRARAMLAEKNPYLSVAPKSGGDEKHGEVWWDVWLLGGALDQLFADAFAEFYPHR